MPLELAEAKERAALSAPGLLPTESKKLEELARKHRVASSTIEVRPTTAFTTVFKRCGYSYSKRLQSLVVSNNAVRSAAFDAVVTAKSPRAPTTALATSKQSRNLLSPQNVHSLHFQSTNADGSGKPQPASQINHQRQHQVQNQGQNKVQAKGRPASVASARDEAPGKSVSQGSKKQAPTSPQNETQTLKAIRNILHPFLPDELVMSDRQHVRIL